MSKHAGVLLIGAVIATVTFVSAAQTAEDDLILVRPTAKSPDAEVDAIKNYVAGKKWVFVGASKVKPPQGEITFVKFCAPEVAKLILPLGLKYSAMLPCGIWRLSKGRQNGNFHVAPEIYADARSARRGRQG